MAFAMKTAKLTVTVEMEKRVAQMVSACIHVQFLMTAYLVMNIVIRKNIRGLCNQKK